MNHLTVFSDALTHLAAQLHDHGPACVCAACTACQQALVLYPRLGHLLAILEAWSHETTDDDPITPEDMTLLLCLLDDDSTVRIVHAEPAP